MKLLVLVMPPHVAYKVAWGANLSSDHNCTTKSMPAFEPVFHHTARDHIALLPVCLPVDLLSSVC
jgi:hypothetical protein